MCKIAVLAIVVSATAIHAQDDRSCALPLATKKEVAIGIFNAVANGWQTAKKRRSYRIEIEDRGESWSIFQVLKGGDSVKYFTGKNGQKMESVKITAGGGGLEMVINKCTAVISDAHLSR